MLYPSKTNSLPLVIAAFLLVTIAAATAHGKVEVVKIQSGAETAEGVLDKEAAAVRGNTFTLNSIDPGESRHLTVAFDYVPLGLAPTNIPIVGGTWTMVIIRKGEYYRTIYGVVERGEILGSTRFCPEEPPAGPLPKSVILDLRGTGVLGDDAAYFSFAHLEVTSDGMNTSGLMELMY